VVWHCLEGGTIFSGKIRPFLPYRISEILPKDSGVTSPTDSLPCRNPMLQNDPFDVEEENEHDFNLEKFIFHVRFSVSKALPPLENLSSSHCIVSVDLMDEL
jgi:hypothetical protein